LHKAAGIDRQGCASAVFVRCVREADSYGHRDRRRTEMGDLVACIENIPQAAARCYPVCAS